MTPPRSAAAAGKEKASKLPSGVASASFNSIGTDSGSTQLPEGIIHIYRSTARPQPPDESPTTSKRPLPAPTDATAGNILAVLAVPGWMNHSDFLTFVAPAADALEHVRILRDFAPNRAIVLLKFRTAQDAGDFAEAYSGKPFGAIEPETCQVVRVASVSIDSAVDDPFERPDEAYELPTCPVCLDRMDSAVTGLVTIPCSHTFHCTCLSRWGDSRCPVCRYSQNLINSSSVNAASHTPSALSACTDCGTTTNLWICLICGNVGCGRYGRGHAQAHFNLTTHLYALELETQRVWDYAGDGYVHRLIQNRADGKVVELPSAVSLAAATPGQGGPGPADAHAADKIEAIGIEYSYLLTSQLDSQRSYYEEQAEDLRDQLVEMQARTESLAREYEERTRQDAARRAEEEERAQEYVRDKQRAEKKAERLAELARKLDHDLKEERAVSQGLMRNLGALKSTAESVEKTRDDLREQVKDLEEQLRDVMFSLEVQHQIEKGGGVEAEAAGGSLEIRQAQSGKARRNRK
ncbi:hypothetical protein BKA62DRAFT_688285 [Auriculariales sp. MPI-PUGE-AT-0066]|nr:hypothetical protein BKA62DRAFT_688285 [Auriculariales sp. MPI-PUGE-AT-0066]